MSRRKSFVRQRTTHCGDNYREVDIFNRTAEQEDYANGKKTKRGARQNITPPKTQDLNDKRSAEICGQMIMANFAEGSYHISASIAPDSMPDSEGKISNLRSDYIDRLGYRCKKLGLAKPEVMNVEVISSDDTRAHFHILLNTDLSREECEELWRARPTAEDYKRSKNGVKAGKLGGWSDVLKRVVGARIGYINCDRVQGELDPLICYLNGQHEKDKPTETVELLDMEQLTMDGAEVSGEPQNPRKNKRRWTCSRNLKRPTVSTNDNAFSNRELAKVAKAQPSGQPDREYWERRFPGWTLYGNGLDYRSWYSDETGWHVHVRLRRIEPIKKMRKNSVT